MKKRKSRKDRRPPTSLRSVTLTVDERDYPKLAAALDRLAKSVRFDVRVVKVGVSCSRLC